MASRARPSVWFGCMFFCAVIAPTLLHISIPNKLNNESRKAYPSMLHRLCLQRRHCYYAATSQARKILRMLVYIQASWPSSTSSEVVCLNQAGTKGNIDLTTQQGHITNMDYGVIGWWNDHYTKLSHWFTRGTGNGWAETDLDTSHTSNRLII